MPWDLVDRRRSPTNHNRLHRVDPRIERLRHESDIVVACLAHLRIRRRPLARKSVDSKEECTLSPSWSCHSWKECIVSNIANLAPRSKLVESFCLWQFQCILNQPEATCSEENNVIKVCAGHCWMELELDKTTIVRASAKTKDFVLFYYITDTYCALPILRDDDKFDLLSGPIQDDDDGDNRKSWIVDEGTRKIPFQDGDTDYFPLSMVADSLLVLSRSSSKAAKVVSLDVKEISVTQETESDDDDDEEEEKRAQSAPTPTTT